jgi:hypothetical protein
MKKQEIRLNRKLTLHKETLRRLENKILEVAAAEATGVSACPHPGTIRCCQTL